MSNIDKEIQYVSETNLMVVTHNDLVEKLIIHEDLKGLLWIGDGRYRNYTGDNSNRETYRVGNILFIIAMNHEEPSLIFTKEQIIIPKDQTTIDRPPYWPTYTMLSPEQKWIYLKLLSNPYDNSINIGYVFLLYYGLERHLLYGDFERAFRVIIKLRDVHVNKSFQSYSANALILTCMLHQRGDLIIDFLKSLDKDYELAFSDNLFLMCYRSFNIPLSPKDIMRMAKTFGFENMNYIKKKPDLFEQHLREALTESIGTDKIDLSMYFPTDSLDTIKKHSEVMFANMSIIDKTIQVPVLNANAKLKREMKSYLEKAHDMVKKDKSKKLS